MISRNCTLAERAVEHHVLPGEWLVACAELISCVMDEMPAGPDRAAIINLIHIAADHVDRSLVSVIADLLEREPGKTRDDEALGWVGQHGIASDFVHGTARLPYWEKIERKNVND